MPEPAAPTNVVHRLHDMVTEEVSLVDRPANKRKFLLVKDEKGGASMGHGAEVTPNADGSFSAAGGAGASSGAAPAQGATTKATISLTAGAKDALTQLLAECTAAIGEVQDSVDGATIVEGEADMDASDIGDTLMTCAEDIEDTLSTLFGTVDPDASEDAGEGGTAPTTVAASVDGPPFEKRLEVARAKRIVKRAEVFAGIKTFVAKYGRKLKKERAMRLTQAMNLLSSVIAEVMPSIDAAATDTTKAGAPPPPAGKPPAGPPPATQGDIDPKTGKPRKKPATTDGAPPPAAATKAADAVIPAEVTKRIADLEKDLKSQHEEMARLRKNIAPSNATPVERTEAAVEDDFNWPMDMNNAVERPGSKNRFGV